MYARPYHHTPSPPSSPSSGPNDSSPPCSPSNSVICLDYSPPPSPVGAVDPFSGNAKATRAPPRNERKPLAPGTPPPPEPSTSRRRLVYSATASSSSLDDVTATRTEMDSPSRFARAVPPPDLEFIQRMQESGLAQPVRPAAALPSRARTEAERWDEAITNIIDGKVAGSEAKSVVDMAGNNYGPFPKLTYIPPSVADLGNLVVLRKQIPVAVPLKLAPSARQLGRAQTAPASAFGGSNQGKTSVRIGSGALAQLISPPTHIVHELQFYLASNAIRVLPLELFRLNMMTVLSLRNNDIDYLPPQIANLKNLRELHVGYNKLAYLPEEMLKMRLNTLTVHPNPFLVAPPRTTSPKTVIEGLLEPTAPLEAPVSETTQLFAGLPPLTELCMRRLLSPAAPSPVPPSFASSLARPKRVETNLAHFYGTIQPEAFHIPEHLEAELRAAAPESLAQPAVATTEAAAGAGAAPHIDRTRTGYGVCPAPHHLRSGAPFGAVFVNHAEERFTWESIVAGVHVGEAPVRWRGCSRGCLVFLGPEPSGEVEGKGKAREEMEVDTDDEQDVAGPVPVVIDGIGLGF